MTPSPSPAAVKLKNCPFCGTKARLEQPDGHVWFQVSCVADDCPANPSVDADTEAEAIAAWNRRRTPGDEIDLVHEVRDLIYENGGLKEEVARLREALEAIVEHSQDVDDMGSYSFARAALMKDLT